MKKIITIILSFLLLAGCMPILHVTLGISNPKKPVSMEKIEKSAKKYKLNQLEHYYITKEGFISYFNTNNENNLKNTANRTYIFKNNKFLRPSMIDGCTSERDGFIRKLTDSLSYVYVDSIDYKKFINKDFIIDAYGNSFDSDKINSEFLILIYWSRFSGIMNKKISANLANTAKECIENELDATAIFVNLDMKDSWFNSIK